MDNVNWEQMERDAVASMGSNPNRTPGQEFTSVWIKFKQGIHKLRILPTGNKVDNLPYLKVGQHVIRLPSREGKIAPVFAWCYTHLWNNLLDQKTDEDKRTKSLIGYLMRSGKMTPEDFKKLQEFGCPVCKGFQHMDMHGVEDDTKNNLRTKYQYVWNVLFRKTQYSGDDKVYVWGIAKKHFDAIIANIRQDKQQGYYTLDPDRGFDLTWQATGEQLARRYGAPVFDRLATPLNLSPDIIPNDLVEIMITQYKPYQEMINFLKQGYGQRLSELGFIAEGDIALQQVYQTPETMQHPVGHQTPQAMANQTLVVNAPQAVAQMPNMAPEKKMLDGGFYTIGNTLYSPDGKALF